MSMMIKRSKEWYETNKKKALEASSQHCKKQVKSLAESYIRKCITWNSLLKSADVPQQLIELYKLKLIAERMLTNGKQFTQNNAGLS